jgi:hypothetical protein
MRTVRASMWAASAAKTAGVQIPCLRVDDLKQWAGMAHLLINRNRLIYCNSQGKSGKSSVFH